MTPDWWHRDLWYDPKHLVAGDDVKHVQRRLALEDHGSFDLNTEAKVRGFQTLHHMYVDGIVDRDVAKAMG